MKKYGFIAFITFILLFSVLCVLCSFSKTDENMQNNFDNSQYYSDGISDSSYPVEWHYTPSEFESSSNIGKPQDDDSSTPYVNDYGQFSSDEELFTCSTIEGAHIFNEAGVKRLIYDAVEIDQEMLLWYDLAGEPHDSPSYKHAINCLNKSTALKNDYDAGLIHGQEALDRYMRLGSGRK